MVDEMKHDILAEASDSSGNKTEYRTTVYNDKLKDITRVEISTGKGRIQEGDSLELSLYAIDSEGNHLVVSPGLVQWSLMTDNSTAELDKSGKFKALNHGKAYVMAQFGTTEEYSHTDAVVINIEEYADDAEKGVAGGTQQISGAEDVLELISSAESRMKEIYTGRILFDRDTDINIDGILSLGIPQGALSSDSNLIVHHVTDFGRLMDKLPGMRLLSPVYNIAFADGVILNTPVSVSFRYDGDSAGDPGRIAVYRLNEQAGRWDYIGGRTDENNSITVQLSRFSKYAVMENSSLRLFDDVPGDRWSRDSIYSLAHLNIVEGVEKDGTYYFLPEKNTTRAEFVEMLMLSLGADKWNTDDVVLPFADMDNIPDRTLKCLKAAYKANVLEGKISGGQLYIAADENITREEACALLGRTLGDSARPRHIYFSDRYETAEYAKNFIDILADMQVLTGYPDNTFRPKNLISHEEAAAIIDRYVKR